MVEIGPAADVTVKLLRQTERGFQCRVHEIMLFDGNKNGSETHDDLPLEFVARRACSQQMPGGRSKRSFILLPPAAFWGISSVAFDFSFAIALRMRSQRRAVDTSISLSLFYKPSNRGDRKNHRPSRIVIVADPFEHQGDLLGGWMDEV
jgi:hypothetical protein